MYVCMHVCMLTGKQHYCIAEKFGGHKVWQIQSSKVLAKKSLVNQHL